MLEPRHLILTNPLTRVKGVFYGWWLVGLTSLVMATATVPILQGMSVWNPVLRSHFGWTPGQMSWALAFMRLEGGLLGPIEGVLVERLGSRRMVFIGMLVIGCGFILFSRIGELWHFFAAFAFIRLGSDLGSWLPMFTALNNWFSLKRARAIGWALLGNPLGAVLFIPVLAWAIDPDADRFGWRATALVIGIFILLLAVPISLLVRNRPEDYGQRPYGYTPDPAPPADHGQARQALPSQRDPTWREAIRTRPFWLIGLGHAGANAAIVTMLVHVGFLLDDKGFSLQEVGWVVATFTGVGAVFLLVSGYIGDRLPIRPATFAFCAAESLPLIILVVADNVPMALLYSVLAGIGWGGRNTLTMTIRGVYFGRQGWASITATSMVPVHVLSLAAPLFAGYMFDYTGSYKIPFVTMALIGFIGSTLFLMLGEPPRLTSSRTGGTEEGPTEI